MLRLLLYLVSCHIPEISRAPLHSSSSSSWLVPLQCLLYLHSSVLTAATILTSPKVTDCSVLPAAAAAAHTWPAATRHTAYITITRC